MNGVKVRSLNREEILPRLIALSKKLIDSREDVLEISLFGSLAKGNYSPGSDADLYVLLKDDSRRFTDRIPEFLDYYTIAELPVEVFPYTVKEIEAMSDSSFIKTIQKTKLILCARNNHSVEAER